MQTVNLNPSERRALDAALAIAVKDSARPVLNHLHVKDGRAFVTDSYCAIECYWAEGLPDGIYDGHALKLAVKGAGREWVRLIVQGDGALKAERFDPGHLSHSVEQGEYNGVTLPDHFMRGTFSVPTVEASSPNIASILETAYAVANGEQDAEQGTPALDPARLTNVLKCHPTRYVGTKNAPMTVVYNGELNPFAIVNGRPFAVIMPMRVR